MRLTDLDPRWYTNGADVRVGVSFACPVHADTMVDGAAPCALSRVYVPTEPHLSGEKRWVRIGDDFATMTLDPSVLCRTVPKAIFESGAEGDADKLVTHWHGFVKGGEVSILVDSEAP